MPRLTEQEQQEIVRYIEADKPLPDRFRFLLFKELGATPFLCMVERGSGRGRRMNFWRQFKTANVLHFSGTCQWNPHSRARPAESFG